VVRLLLSLALLSSIAGTLHAQPGPFFEPDALEPQGYEVRASAEYHDVARRDFSRSIFLFAQPLEELEMRELLVSVELRLSITPALAVQLVLPWFVREAEARTVGLQVGEEQTLRPRSLELSSWGVGDPLLAVAYRLFRQRPWGAYVELGATIPIDDNPGSAVLATRVPLGTGQHELFVGAGGTLERPIALSLSYRFSYLPGEHAAFLIRRTGTQTYTSGAFAPFMRQRVHAAAELTLSRLFSIVLAPAWIMTEIPLLVERNNHRQVVFERFLHELYVSAAVRIQLDRRNRLELRYTQPLLDHWTDDPFFPIVTPTRGAGVTWQHVGS
jgi:hypothetical protein